MKFSLILASLLALKQVVCFVPAQNSITRSTSLSAKELQRSEFLQKVAGIVGLSTLAAPGTANAAKYGGFGAGSPNVLDPKDAIIDEDILKSDAVQNARNGIKGYLNGVQQMQEALKKNGQTDVGPFLRKDYDFVKLREALNTVNSAFDEDTQKGTDRLIRNILQDITELETANRQKEGVPRSDIRLGIMLAKLDKLASAFADYLAFSS
mmetsp:Transcript_28483/g.42097  ORF Transcript_28483/g.42097 Transcript_28483/m.42097 type:complete len:209 (+) Transcript_28483:136-762(+)